MLTDKYGTKLSKRAHVVSPVSTDGFQLMAILLQMLTKLYGTNNKDIF